ncbi:MAG: sugar phosphate isomerase/epimerase family protein [Armatimonadota bacterium]|nr:sugar phosphate isomerase/epimerase family protein [Armatimonadota bacterium]MDR7485261.1 sugar phosphate isomerase/epimerase family protein [Armatimonadota bacterium]MDR7533901.1 sugar phosphate isomerase/epimerase family protein [Armatimonadota bacterium]
MKIAASTTTTRDLPLADAVRLAGDLGYDALEVWAEHVWEQGVDPRRLGAAATARGLALSVHGPIRDLNVTSSNPAIRAESQRQYLAGLETARELGAAVVVVHPGAMSSSGDAPEAYWPALEEFFGRLADRAGALGLRAGVENMERRRLEIVTTTGLALRLVRAVDRPALGLALDVAHVLYNRDPLDVPALLPHICHVHLSGSTATAVHVPLADGAYDLGPALRALENTYGGIAAIEGYVPGRAPEVLAANLEAMRALRRRTGAARSDAAR